MSGRIRSDSHESSLVKLLTGRVEYERAELLLWVTECCSHTGDLLLTAVSEGLGSSACRFSILLGIGLSQGITLGQLISVALDISGSGLIFTALAGACCFSRPPIASCRAAARHEASQPI